MPPPPAKSVELTGYVLESLAQPDESAPLPSELESVVAQLKRAFRYPAYRLLDTLIARGVDGARLEATALASTAEDSPLAMRTRYSLSAGRVHVLTGAEGPTVRLQYLAFNCQIPVPVGPAAASSVSVTSVGINSDILIRAGQRVVVGKSGSPEQPANAIFLVLSAKVSD